jgi:hypothetical protein
MKKNSSVWGAAVGIVTLVVLLIGFVIVRPVSAQEESTTTDQVVNPMLPVDAVSSSTPNDTPVDGTDASATVEDSSTSTVNPEPPPPPPPPSTTGDDSGTVLGASTGTDTAESAPTTGTTSSSSDTTSDTSVPTGSEETPTTDSQSATAASNEASSQRETPPAGMTEVHIIGTKYTDYFTDGTTVTSYPGDPDIDSHLSEPNAPIPTHEGLTWVHTSGQNLYDTPSGDLEVGQYAVQPDGSYIQNAPPSLPFVSSTSTPISDTPTDDPVTASSSSADTSSSSSDSVQPASTESSSAPAN